MFTSRSCLRWINFRLLLCLGPVVQLRGEALVFLPEFTAQRLLRLTRDLRRVFRPLKSSAKIKVAQFPSRFISLFSWCSWAAPDSSAMLDCNRKCSDVRYVLHVKCVSKGFTHLLLRKRKILLFYKEFCLLNYIKHIYWTPNLSPSSTMCSKHIIVKCDRKHVQNKWK